MSISIHKALAGLDVPRPGVGGREAIFQSTRPSRASTIAEPVMADEYQAFQSTRPSRASTAMRSVTSVLEIISIHKALAGLDCSVWYWFPYPMHFNPQGPRGPRRPGIEFLTLLVNFNPQGPRGPRLVRLMPASFSAYFNPQGPRGPRRYPVRCF